MANISLRAARETDLPRLKEIWRASFGEEQCDWFFENCFVPGHVESSLVLLEDDAVQSMTFFLPSFWYSGAEDSYEPAPCLVGLATAPERRRGNYASWLVETACGFLAEKGAGGVWTLLPDGELTLFFAAQGFWTLERTEENAVSLAELPQGDGAVRRAAPEQYDETREALLQGMDHAVLGPMLTAFQGELAQRRGGGLFLLSLSGGESACAVAEKNGSTLVLRELLGAEDREREAMALLGQELGAETCVRPAPVGMLRLMNGLAKLERPKGYLGCGLPL